MKVIGNPDTMSANPKDRGLKVDIKGKVVQPPAWTLTDEAIHRGMNYSDHTMKILMNQDWKPLLHTLLKEAYQQGFLHGFEHKFDNHNYKGDK